MSKGKQQEVIISHYMKVNGEFVKVDPFDSKFSDFHDRCKLAWAEMTTGVPHRLVKRAKASGS